MENVYSVWVEAHGAAANSKKWLALWSIRSTRRIEELRLDTENVLNSRTLSWVEDDIEFPKLTPHLLITGQNLSLTDEYSETENKGFKKRFNYIENANK